MIYDLYKNKDLYLKLGKEYEKAFEFIKKVEEENLPAGKYEIDGKNLYANVSEYDTKSENAYEAHKDYIDLQYIVSGHECIYWKNIKDCTPTMEYNAEGDYCLYTAKDPVVLDMTTGAFAILFPEDVHAPCISYNGETAHQKKVVVKIKID